MGCAAGDDRREGVALCAFPGFLPEPAADKSDVRCGRHHQNEKENDYYGNVQKIR